MVSRALARRYAQAAMQIAGERNEVETWRQELGRAAQVLADPDLLAALQHGRVPLEQRLELARRTVLGLSPLVMNLVLLLVARGRVGVAGAIAEEFGAMADERSGVAMADVVTATPLEDEPLRQQVAEWLRGISGRRVTLRTAVDPGVVGGVVARIGDRLVDASIRTRLEVMRRALAGGGAVESMGPEVKV